MPEYRVSAAAGDGCELLAKKMATTRRRIGLQNKMVIKNPLSNSALDIRYLKKHLFMDGVMTDPILYRIFSIEPPIQAQKSNDDAI